MEFALGREGMATMQGRTLPVRKIDLDALAGMDSIDFQRLVLATAESDVKVSGTVENFSQPKFNLSTDATLALQPLTSFAGVQPPASGTIHFTAKVSGPMDSLDTQFTLQGSPVRYGEFRDVNLSLEGQYNRERNQVELSSLRVQSPFGNIRAQGGIALGEPGTSSVQAEVQHLNLQKVTRAFDLGVRIASTASGTVNLTWPGMNYRLASGKASLNLKKLQPNAARNEIPISGDVQAVARNGRLTLTIGGPSASPQALGAMESFRAGLEKLFRWRTPPSRSPISKPVQEGEVPSAQAASRPLLRRHVARLPSEGSEDPDYASPPAEGVRLQRVAFSASAAGYPAMEGARLNVSPRILLALFAFAQTQSANPQSSRALEVLATRLHGQISITAQGGLSGTLHANITDLGKFLADLADFQGKPGSLLPVTVRGATAVTATLGGTLQRPAAD